MKVDYSKYPEIPKGCSTNYNKARDVYQVYIDHRVYDPELGKKVNRRETIGQIKKGVFTFSKLYKERQKNAKLTQQLAKTDQEDQKFTNKTENLVNRLDEVIVEAKLDSRQQTKVIYPLEPLALAALASALTGCTDCQSICQLLNENRTFFRRFYPQLPDTEVTHDLVYRSLYKTKPEQFDLFFQKMIAPMVHITKDRVIAGDGQAIRASTAARNNEATEEQYRRRGFMLMNFYDSTNRVCLSQRLIDSKTNEITVGPEMLKAMNIQGCIVTADAMSCQMTFAQAVLDAGADYCISLKGNQDRSCKEVQCLFGTTHSDQIERYEAPIELDHGRIENRTVSVIRGGLLSDLIKEKWAGLKIGCIVQIRSRTTDKSSGKDSFEERYYISSLPAEKRTAERLCNIIQAHWSVENKLHWALDIHFDQDRIQAGDTRYIANRVAVNKLALAMLENYRYWLWSTNKTKEVMSIRSTMQHCRSLHRAIECIAWSQGIA